ncbi:16269_t:CDS:2 [Entrophospora sp. SA101]|nr:16269_t:CDS:2 [Entrophospora sp. SA101]
MKDDGLYGSILKCAKHHAIVDIRRGIGRPHNLKSGVIYVVCSQDCSSVEICINSIWDKVWLCGSRDLYTELENSDSANSDDFEEMISYFDEEFENNSESLFQLLINYMKNYKAKRPLTYHGNSTRAQKRRKASTKENINKNGQTLDQFFILKKDSSKEMTQNNDSQNIEIKLDESFDIAKSYNLRLKALQHYFQLLKRNHKKFEAANLVSKILNKGPWFSKCIRSWGKSFIEYGDISYKKRGKHLRGSIIDEDVQIKISSFLRKEKFNVTVNNFKEFIAKDIFPSIGVENETAIR